MIFWAETTLDANLNELDDGAAVTIWNDIVNDLDLNAPSDAEPSYVKDGINGLPSISFNGVDSVLFTERDDDLSMPIGIGSSKYSMAVVFRPLSVTGNQVLVSQKSYGDVGNESAQIMLDTDDVKFNGNANNTASLGTLNIDSNYIFIMTVNNIDINNVRGYLNNSTSSNMASLNRLTLEVGIDLFSIGALDNRSEVDISPSNDDYANSLISEVILFERNLNPSEVVLVNGYLSEKYNITVN
ncbi:MAG: hypothetical protein ACJAW3_001500 [Lentimonas sp.]|jgi:hypothetical protein